MVHIFLIFSKYHDKAAPGCSAAWVQKHVAALDTHTCSLHLLAKMKVDKQKYKNCIKYALHKKQNKKKTRILRDQIRYLFWYKAKKFNFYTLEKSEMNTNGPSVVWIFDFPRKINYSFSRYFIRFYKHLW